MKGLFRTTVVASVFLVAGLALNSAMASPVIDSAIVKTRIFNDDPSSTVTSGNLYPTSLWIKDQNVYTGWANRHNFRLSDNGGINEAVFMNADGFAFAADVTLTGSGDMPVEGGLNLSPWWSKDVDGVFMLNTGGEIALFGGRLPFFSFTNTFGVHYALGETVRIGLAYDPRGLTESNPGAIAYWLTQGATTYASGWLPFDQGNPAEDPPYGLWGILNDARVGGYVQVRAAGTPGNWGRIDVGNMDYVPEPASLVLLGLASLLGLRRR